MLNILVVVFFIIAISLFICWLLMNNNGVSYKRQRIDQDPISVEPIPASDGDLPMNTLAYLGGPYYLQKTKGGM
jgi:hypothetical protein